MLIESGNPAHSLADSQRMREAIRALEFSLVIDVAMTETARQADYVLPAASQFEKAEATFFNMEFPRNAFHLRAPLFEPLAGTLPEAEIHARLLEAMGELSERDYRPLRRALKFGRTAFTLAFAWLRARDPRIARYAPVVLYRTLGETLPKGMASAAVVWGICQIHAAGNRKTLAQAGFGGMAPFAANQLFDALLTHPSGLVFAQSAPDDSWNAIPMAEHRINLHIPELLPDLTALAHSAPPHDPQYPFVLAAGERRSDTSNTAVRDTGWHKRGRYGTLRMNPADAATLDIADGERVQLSTRRGSVLFRVEAELYQRDADATTGLRFHCRSWPKDCVYPDAMARSLHAWGRTGTNSPTALARAPLCGHALAQVRAGATGEGRARGSDRLNRHCGPRPSPAAERRQDRRA